LHRPAIVDPPDPEGASGGILSRALSFVQPATQAFAGGRFLQSSDPPDPSSGRL
jgi:hypothetical protein